MPFLGIYFFGIYDETNFRKILRLMWEWFFLQYITVCRKEDDFFIRGSVLYRFDL